MAVSNVSSDSASLVDYLNSAANRKDNEFGNSSVLAQAERWLETGTTKKASKAYTTNSSETGKAALNKALEELGSNGQRVTFKDVAEYRKQLEADFTLNMRAEMAKQGVSLDTEFSLHLSSEGKISVQCDDALAKDRIENYLNENPDVCEQFGYIQALANLERARQSPAAGTNMWKQVSDAKASLQTKAMEAFFSDAMSSGMNYGSMMANFSPSTSESESSASFYAGLDFTV